jgi:hypothetical protein
MLSRWLSAAIIGAGLACVTVAAHVRKDADPIEHVSITPIIKVIVPSTAERAFPAIAPSSPSSPTLPSARFRFGFLEFEDDADAPPR